MSGVQYLDTMHDIAQSAHSSPISTSTPEASQVLMLAATLPAASDFGGHEADLRARLRTTNLLYT